MQRLLSSWWAACCASTPTSPSSGTSGPSSRRDTSSAVTPPSLRWRLPRSATHPTRHRSLHPPQGHQIQPHPQKTGLLCQQFRKSPGSLRNGDRQSRTVDPLHQRRHHCRPPPRVRLQGLLRAQTLQGSQGNPNFKDVATRLP